LDTDNDWVVSTKNQFKVPSNYCAIPEYNPGKFREYAITNENALHGRLIEDKQVRTTVERFLEDGHYLDSSIDEADNVDFFDAHCHLFGRSVVSGRIILMLLADLIDYFKEDDPDELLPPISLREKTSHSSSFNTTAKNILKYFILNKDAHDMLHDLEEDYHKSQAEVYRYVPLMFDLEMTFKNNYDGDDTSENLAQIIDGYQAEHQKMVKRIETLIKKASQGKKVFSGFKSELDSSLKLLKKILWIFKQLNKLTDSLNKDTEESFHKQLMELQRLKLSYGNDVFPFLATDPRRTNMGTYIEAQVGSKKPFHGIKLYTPNGYSPTDPNLYDTANHFTHSTSLYQWCVDSHIPIMAHNSDSGFATFTDRLQVYGDICTGLKDADGRYKLEYKNKEFIDFQFHLFHGGFGSAVKERAHTLNHPTLWRKVLNQYPQLKICLAHFGGGSVDWQNEIAQLIIDFDNVYTDLSCQTNKERLEEIKEAYFISDSDEHKKIRSRVMYGSDYFLNLLHGTKFDNYYQNFTQVFTPEQIKVMSVEVPKNFLGI
jgi:predicted TIM-barrel fold metal-dependent hydrolase